MLPSSPNTSSSSTVEDISERAEINRLRELAGPPPWAEGIADQLSQVLAALQDVLAAVEKQGRQVDTLADAANQIATLGDSIPPGLLENMGSLFGGK